jgi:hypothetical protein
MMAIASFLLIIHQPLACSCKFHQSITKSKKLLCDLDTEFSNSKAKYCQASNEKFVVSTKVLRKIRTKVLTTSLLTPQFKADRLTNGCYRVEDSEDV